MSHKLITKHVLFSFLLTKFVVLTLFGENSRVLSKKAEFFNYMFWKGIFCAEIVDLFNNNINCVLSCMSSLSCMYILSS